MTVNGAPVIAVPGAQTVALGTATAIAGVSLAESGTTGSETFTVTLKDSNGLLSASGATSGNNSTDLVISGTLSQVNADLGTLKDTDNSAGPDTITLTASDSFGNAATPATVAVTASVTPVITVPGAQTLGINQLTAISGISLAESGNTGGETFTVTLVDSNGQLSATGGVQSNGGHTLTFTGLSLTTLNSDLGTLKDTDGTAGPDTITVNASDSFGNSATAQTIAVTANGVPVITVPGAQTIGHKPVGGDLRRQPDGERQHGWRDVYGDGDGQHWGADGDRWRAIQWRSHADLYRTVADHLEQRPGDAEGHRWHGGSGHYYRQCQRQLWQRRYGADDCGDGERGAGDYGAGGADARHQPAGGDLRRQPGGERQHGQRDVYGDGGRQQWSCCRRPVACNPMAVTR